jgi:hypothetical protein
MSNRKKLRDMLDQHANGPLERACCHGADCDCDPETGHAGELMVATMNAMTTPPDCDTCAAWITDVRAYYDTAFTDQHHLNVIHDPDFTDNAPKMPDCFIYPLNHGGVICEHSWWGGWCGAHQGKPAPKGWTGAHVG